MRQREIWFADLNPVKGREQSGKRPIVIVSGDAMNDNLEILIVCPLSSSVKNFAGCLVLEPDSINSLSKSSEILTFQIRTLSKSRLINKIGEITEIQLMQIKNGLIDILTY